ncbi:hypothetical protein UA75_22525 [Actinoalloteichus sp. GBA129-24]|uniref:Uncharacterized protein n=2 Tax=Actinoalloteichus TaxID=65496 RepID=A0AAC9PT96_9PSEU|nr:hypothetical protein UA74_22055 [Actinoalloteichus fjordicus]APU22487.1 hypothetical protein UA75_22525 [Actinoalloteichus sp. GBA129-24]
MTYPAEWVSFVARVSSSSSVTTAAAPVRVIGRSGGGREVGIDLAPSDARDVLADVGAGCAGSEPGWWDDAARRLQIAGDAALTVIISDPVAPLGRRIVAGKHRSGLAVTLRTAITSADNAAHGSHR